MKFKIIFLLFIIAFIFYLVFYIRESRQPLLSPLSEVKIEKVEAVEEVKEYFGEASWYGTGEGECLGCSENLIMANGQKLDDTKLTVACGLSNSCKYLNLGDKLLITNLDNSKQVIVVVTDKGGLRAGRLLDVSKAVRDILEFEGLANIKFSIINLSPLKGKEEKK